MWSIGAKGIKRPVPVNRSLLYRSWVSGKWHVNITAVSLQKDLKAKVGIVLLIGEGRNGHLGKRPFPKLHIPYLRDLPYLRKELIRKISKGIGKIASWVRE
jgi:hypothetical protein